MIDPTRDEMLAHLRATCPYADEFDTECAIYWFASDYHGGQSSNLYAALCGSEYHPGMLENECPPDGAADCYAELLAFAGAPDAP
jgi:hypothetical protein